MSSPFFIAMAPRKKTTSKAVKSQPKSDSKHLVDKTPRQQQKALNKIYNVTTPNQTRAFTKSDEQNSMQDYIPFGVGNLLPQKLAELYRKASTSRAILNTKTQLLVGKGFQSENKAVENRLKDPISIKGETLNAVESKVAKDCWIFGNGYIMVSKRGGTTFFSHKDATQVRVKALTTEERTGNKKIETKFIIHPNFRDYEATKEFAVTIPEYPEFSKAVDGTNHSLIQIKDYEPEWTYYGLPEYIGAYSDGSLDTDYLISKYNFDRLKNGFMPSCIIDVFADMDESDADNFIKAMSESFTGEDNSFKMFIRVMSDASMETKVQFLTDELQGSYLELMETVTSKIVRANRIFPELAGIQTAGKLGTSGAKELINQYELVMNTVIIPKQDTHLEVWNNLFEKELKIKDPQLTFINAMPISFKSLIDIDKTLTKNEKREILGYKATEETSVREALDGREIAAMLEIAVAVRNGSLPPESGVKMLMVTYGIEEKEAKDIIPVPAPPTEPDEPIVKPKPTEE